MSHVDIHSESFQTLPEKVSPQPSRLAFASHDPYYTHSTNAIPVTIRFHNGLVDEVLDKFGFAIHLIPDGPHFFTTTVTLEPTPEFLGWIFSLGNYVEIVAPESVKSSMYYRASSASRKYKRKKNV